MNSYCTSRTSRVDQHFLYDGRLYQIEELLADRIRVGPRPSVLPPQGALAVLGSVDVWMPRLAQPQRFPRARAVVARYARLDGPDRDGRAGSRPAADAELLSGALTQRAAGDDATGSRATWVASQGALGYRLERFDGNWVTTGTGYGDLGERAS